MRNDDSTRQIVRSRTPMSYAFEAAVRRLIHEPNVGPSRRALGLGIASALGNDKGRKTPTWTVTRKEPRR